MKKFIFVSFLLLFVTASFTVSATNDSKPEAKAPATLTSMSGLVLDAATGEALVGAVIEVEGTDLKTYTDLEGKFSLENVKVGEYNIKVNYISYCEKTVEKVKLNTETEGLQVKLNPEGN